MRIPRMPRGEQPASDWSFHEHGGVDEEGLLIRGAFC
jgi:hypothetical protein